MDRPPFSFDRATGRLDGATGPERCAALAFAAGAKVSAPMHYRATNSPFWEERIRSIPPSTRH